jgi:hypothetical protein
MLEQFHPGWKTPGIACHCEERSDEAIPRLMCRPRWSGGGLLRRYAPRNDIGRMATVDFSQAKNALAVASPRRKLAGDNRNIRSA